MSTYHDLADAMRKGAALRPQTTIGVCFEWVSIHEPFASCSIGAAVEAVEGPFDWREVPDWCEAAEVLYDAFSCVAEAAPPCPDPTCDGTNSFHMRWDARDCLQDLINHLNDEHKWTREQIADFIDSLAGAA